MAYTVTILESHHLYTLSTDSLSNSTQPRRITTMQQSKFRQEYSSGTRLSLAKFSYTTTPIDHPGPLSWSHLNGNGDLVCIFDKFAATGSASSKLIMKVIRNDSVLVLSTPLLSNQLKSFAMKADCESNTNRNRLTSHASYNPTRHRMDLYQNLHSPL